MSLNIFLSNRNLKNGEIIKKILRLIDPIYDSSLKFIYD